MDLQYWYFELWAIQLGHWFIVWQTWWKSVITSAPTLIRIIHNRNFLGSLPTLDHERNYSTVRCAYTCLSICKETWQLSDAEATEYFRTHFQHFGFIYQMQKILVKRIQPLLSNINMKHKIQMRTYKVSYAGFKNPAYHTLLNSALSW